MINANWDIGRKCHAVSFGGTVVRKSIKITPDGKLALGKIKSLLFELNVLVQVKKSFIDILKGNFMPVILEEKKLLTEISRTQGIFQLVGESQFWGSEQKQNFKCAKYPSKQMNRSTETLIEDVILVFSLTIEVNQ